MLRRAEVQSFLRALGARFDDVALRPFEVGAAVATPWPALRDWCLADLPAAPWRVACHAGPDPVLSMRRAGAVALELDGTFRLQACSGALGRLQLRLAVKLQDVQFSRPAQAGDVWDCGYVPDTQSAWQALLCFEPRRPTFIVVRGAMESGLAQALATLGNRGFAKPVRVLVLAGDAQAPLPGATCIPA